MPQWISTVELSKVKSKKAASCPNNSRQSSSSGPWSFEWIKYHHLGDVGLIYFLMKERIKLMIVNKLKNLFINLIFILLLLTCGGLLECLLKTAKYYFGCSRGIKTKRENLFGNITTTASEGELCNWVKVKLHDKSDGGSKDIVDIGKAINLQFKGDTSNIFQVLSRPSNYVRHEKDGGRYL